MKPKLICACGKSHKELEQKIYSAENTEKFLKVALKEQAKQIFREIMVSSNGKNNPCMKCGSIECAVCWEDLQKLTKKWVGE